MKIGLCWLKSILPIRRPLYRRAVLIFQQENRGEKTSFPSRSPCQTSKQTPAETGWQEPQEACQCLGARGRRYWPERAGAHLQRGSGRICIRRGGPRWCRWWPDGTASPPFCHCRVWATVRWASRKSRRRSPDERRTKGGKVAAEMCSGQRSSLLHRRTEKGRLQPQIRVRSKWSLFSRVDSQALAVTFGMKTDGEMVSRAKFTLCLANASICEWMDEKAVEGLAMQESNLLGKLVFDSHSATWQMDKNSFKWHD